MKKSELLFQVSTQVKVETISSGILESIKFRGIEMISYGN